MSVSPARCARVARGHITVIVANAVLECFLERHSGWYRASWDSIVALIEAGHLGFRVPEGEAGLDVQSRRVIAHDVRLLARRRCDCLHNACSEKIQRIMV